MKTIKNIFGMNKKPEQDNIITYNQSEFDGFLVYSGNEPIKKDNTQHEIKNIINPNKIEDSNYYKKNWDDLEQIEEHKKPDLLFEELMENISKIVNNNLIDFTCKYIYLFYI